MRTTKQPDPPFDINALMAGIMRVESNDDRYMINPTSTATGRYGQLFSEIEGLPELDGMSREEFADAIGLQDQIFTMRAEGMIPGVPGLIDTAFDLTEEYSSQLDDFNFRPDEVAALTNYLGRQGARNYFASLRDGTEYKVPGTNKTPEEYLEKYNEGVSEHLKRESRYQDTQPTRTVDTDFKPIKNAKGGRVVKYQNGGKGPGDPPKRGENRPSTQELMDALEYYDYMFSNQRVRDAVRENVGTYEILDEPMFDDDGNPVYNGIGRQRWSRKDVFDNFLRDRLQKMYPNRNLETSEDLADAYMDMRTDLLQAGVGFDDPVDDPMSTGYVRAYKDEAIGSESEPLIMGLGPQMQRRVMEFEVDSDRKGLSRIGTITHELSHAQESGTDVPEELVYYMKERKLSDSDYNKEREAGRVSMGRQVDAGEEVPDENYDWGLEEFFRKYFTQPTETLARLNAARRLIYENEGGQLLKKPSMLQQEGTPFSQELTYEDLNKYYQEVPEFKDVMDELTPHYTRDGLIEMLNNVYNDGGRVSSKIRVLKKEGKPQKQAVAIALDMLKRGKL